MGQKSKRFREIANIVGEKTDFSLKGAIAILKKCPPVKFDQSVEISLKLGVDPRKADQQVRGTVSLPKGTGKSIVILAFAKGAKAQDAINAGADYAGADELIEKVNGGWTDFDAVVTTPDMMREVGKLGKILGPRGLMPTPKAGTVTTDIVQAIKELKAGKIEFKVDRHGDINNAVGKISFSEDDLEENIRKYLNAIMHAKPSSAKGHYVKSVSLSSTMGPGLKIDTRDLDVA